MTVLVMVVCMGGCGDSEAGHATEKAKKVAEIVIVPATKEVYQTMSLQTASDISGSVFYAGAAPSDSIVHLASDKTACNKPLEIVNFARKNERMSEAVVFLTNVRIGKKLPLEKRYEVRKSDCAFTPHMQVVARGGGVTFFNADNVIEDGSVVDLASAKIKLKLPFSDPGQAIPSIGLLDVPAALKVSIDSRPMSSAYLVVLDHPYHAITGADGDFVIRDVPPGLYTLRAWHPRLGTVDKVVEVKGGAAVKDVELRFVETQRNNL